MDTKITCQELRHKGWSFREIANKTNTPVSTVFLWTKNIKLTNSQIAENKLKSNNRLQASKIMAQKLKKDKYINNNILNQRIGASMVGKVNEQNINEVIAALYWGEGFKKDRRLGLANTDPKIIKLFIYWLINIARVPKEMIRLKVGINVAFEKETKKIMEFWSKVTKIPLKQFQKPFIQHSKIKRIYPDLKTYNGVLRIRANGQNDVFQKLLGMVDGLKSGVDMLDID